MKCKGFKPGGCLGVTLGLAFLLCGPISGCKKKPEDGKAAGSKVFEVKELGVKLTAPADWALKQRGSGWALMSGMKGVILNREEGPMPSSPEEAGKRFSDSKILASEKLPSGAIYVFYEMKFPAGEGKEPMMLKFVYSVVALAAGGVAVCQIQLQKDDEQALYEPICKSMEPL